MSPVEGGGGYEIPPLDRSGLLFGFGFGEVLVVGLASIGCFGLIQAGAAFWVYSPLLVAVIVAARRPWPGGLQLLEYLPVLTQRRARRATGGRWHTMTPWPGGTTSRGLPPVLAGIETAEVTVAGVGEVGFVVDQSRAAATFIVELASSSFLLRSEVEQRELLDRWGRLIGASVVAGHNEIRHLSFTLISSQGTPRDHLRYTETAAGRVVPTRPAGDYRRLIERGTATAVNHRILFSVTVAAARPNTTATWGLPTNPHPQEPEDGGGRGGRGREELLGGAARMATSMMHHLASLGWPRQHALSEVEVRRLFGECADPGTRLGRNPQGDQSLDAVLGITAEARPPWSVVEDREYVVINGVAHRSFWVRTWPNYTLGPDWMIRFCNEVTGERRVTLYIRPVPRTESVRGYERDMARHDAAVIAAEEKGRRVSLSTRRAQQTAVELGEDLMAGYPEVELCALTTISAATPELLRRRCDAFGALASSHGIQLVPLRDAQQLAWAHSAPFGLCPIKPRTPWN